MDNISRKSLFKQGLGAAGLLAANQLSAAANRKQLLSHFPAKAKHVIFCFMQGGVAQMDSFDPKPELSKRHNKKFDLPSNTEKSQASDANRKWLGSPWKFKKYGQSGMDVSELFPHLATCVDDITFIRSTVAELPLHSVGNIMLHSGRFQVGFPSFGSWVSYGLGVDNQKLPGYILLHHDEILPGGSEIFSSGFLPAEHQATPIRSTGTAIDNLNPYAGGLQSAKLKFIHEESRRLSERFGSVADFSASINNSKLAYQLQESIPEVLDISKESEYTKKLYGLDSKKANKKKYALQCLRARRLVEAGARFIEIVCPNETGQNGTWDQHGGLKKHHAGNAFNTDQPIAGLIHDLKMRGLLDETIIVWAGEMGRTPHSANMDGRDHHTAVYTTFIAGGGFKKGYAYGRSDDFGMEVTENPVSVHDLHATVLHQLGIEHEKLTFRFGGRDFTLPDVHGDVILDLLA